MKESNIIHVEREGINVSSLPIGCIDTADSGDNLHDDDDEDDSRDDH